MGVVFQNGGFRNEIDRLMRLIYPGGWDDENASLRFSRYLNATDDADFSDLDTQSSQICASRTDLSRGLYRKE